MRSLDILSSPRPKPESGRAPAGEDARSGAAPGFDAMFDAFESGTAPGGAAPETTETGAEASPAEPAVTLIAAGTDTSGSALQALMALAGPVAPNPASGPSPGAALGSDAGLEAMVQRAVTRAGSRPNTAPPEAAVQMSMVGLETHFAPVRPRGAAASAEAGTGRGLDASNARPTLPAPEDASAKAVAEAARSAAGTSSPLRVATALQAETATQGRMGEPNGLLPPSAGAMPASAPGRDLREPASGSDRPVAIRGGLAPAAHASVSGSPASADTARAPTPGDPVAASPVPPATPDLGPNHAAEPAAQPTAVAAAMQAADAHRSATGRARTALRDDPAEPAGAVPTALPPSDATTSADLTEPAAVVQPGNGGAVRHGPEPAERPAGLARSEPAPERAAATMPRVEADAARGASAGTDSTEAPRPERPHADPTPQAAANAAASATAPLPAPPPASPLRQIVDAVAAQLPAAPVSQARPLPTSAEAGPLKILTLQLHPAELGSVLVRMRLQDGRLEMSLRTSREETAERLRKEGDLLSGLLREAGYEPEAVTIQAGSTGPGESGARGQGFAAFGSQGGQQDRQPGAATPDQSGRRPSPRADAAALSSEEQDHESDTRGRDRDSLYL
ncbi:flagellar hook-length control protein FliK [Methylorubrum populi]|uniref:flagellar hook-length control protein FliK n=1 Tax=Methylorubrum populi TaxID=223967 RepID=UPI003F658D30